MTVIRAFNEKTVENIARDSGSKAAKQSVAWLRKACYNNPNRFICEILDETAFWAGTVAKSHLRLYEIAVRTQNQRKGYGRAMISRIKSLCRERGLSRITLRTSKQESAVDFYLKNGARIVGEKGSDWEMEILV